MVGDDTGEFAAFYRQNYSLILATCERRLGSRSTAEDAASEVFRVAWTRYRAGAELSLPWLYVVARNVIGNEYRRTGRADALAEKAAHHHRDHLDAQLEDTRVRDALRRLREKDRELLFMAYWEDLSGAEMAEILGCSVSALWVRLNRARTALRKQLDDDDRNGAAGDRHG